ncbi:hypothetical protein CY35_03G101900 [Sphagnum magellanicum]|jgi:hypothetical protein|nr:hypothetical protein CY35_03G101900 [Sphagnum magellanicum]KAH9568881.1 hypothetical protein CY35_03G101900 [Sphagnum magellanicum]
MATREAMEQLKATLNGKDSPLYHPPTLRPGIGPPRCPRCSAPLSNDLEASGWTIAPFMRESFAMVGTTAGGSMSALYGFNAVMPHVKKQIGGPIWFQLLVGLPPIMIFSVGCAGLAGGALPAFAQLAVSTYHAASASSHAAISQVTVHVEEQKSHPNSKSQLEDSQPKPTSPQTAISQMR